MVSEQKGTPRVPFLLPPGAVLTYYDYQKHHLWREGNGKLATLASQFNDHNVAWYDAATRIFPEDSAEGAMIRSTIPTYISPPVTPEPPPAPTP